MNFNISYILIIYNSLFANSWKKIYWEGDFSATKRIKNAWKKEKVRHFHLETHPDGSSPSCSAAQKRSNNLLQGRKTVKVDFTWQHRPLQASNSRWQDDILYLNIWWAVQSPAPLKLQYWRKEVPEVDTSSW